VGKKGFYLLGHAEDLAACMLLARELLLVSPSTAGAELDLPGGRTVCKVRRWLAMGGSLVESLSTNLRLHVPKDIIIQPCSCD
jgi:hypothetical protein